MNIAEQIIRAKSDYDEVYEAGKQMSYDELWDNLQNYGERGTYDGAFIGWAGAYCRPKYKVAPTGYANTNYGFLRFLTTGNVVAVEKEYFDLSQVGLPTGSASVGWRQLFQNCKNLEVVEDIGMQPACYYFTFSGCSALHTIEVLRFAEDTRENQGFGNCIALENITIEGVIGQNLSFKDCPLSVDSVMSVLTHLKNYSGSGTKPTLTLSTTSKNFMTTQGEIAELGGKTYDAYITDMGWDLA